MNATSRSRPAGDPPALRWGFVGTGTIANWMAAVVGKTPAAVLAAVASRNLDTAAAFAERHGVENAFSSWQEMLAWEGIDAVYVATPTGLREEICVAGANGGKHVLGEKPFASLPSLRRIIAACRENDVGFMDATHFVHHPRYAAVRATMAETIGRPRELDTSFLVRLTDRSDIRYDPTLEPLGAIGDLGWYNMRATLEYLAGDAELASVTTRLRRDRRTGTVIAGEGALCFGNGTVSRWRCGFDATGVDIQLELRGNRGKLDMENFVGEEDDDSATYRCGGRGPSAAEKTVRVESQQSGPALMFRNFAKTASDASLRENWSRASERTQALLDAVLDAAQS